jgi:hypothetical protein
VSCALLLETVVRLTEAAPVLKDQRNWIADPLIPFKLAPFSTRVKAPHPGARPVEYRHNSLGFRDVEHARQKAPGIFRVVAVGDSFTYGVGVDFAHSYLARLEAMLNADGRSPTEIIKLGLPRYFPAAERLVLDHYGWVYAPDLVLVAVQWNDVIDTSLGLDAVVVDSSGFLVSRQARRLGRVGLWLFLHSHVMRMLLHRGLEADPSIPPEQIWRDDGVYERAWRAMETDLDAMHESAPRNGARFAVLNIPSMNLWNQSNVYTDARLARWAQSRGVVYISTLERLRAASGQGELYWPIDGHCTTAGYDVIAKTVYDALVRIGFPAE